MGNSQFRVGVLLSRGNLLIPYWIYPIPALGTNAREFGDHYSKWEQGPMIIYGNLQRALTMAPLMQRGSVDMDGVGRLEIVKKMSGWCATRYAGKHQIGLFIQDGPRHKAVSLNHNGQLVRETEWTPLANGSARSITNWYGATGNGATRDQSAAPETKAGPTTSASPTVLAKPRGSAVEIVLAVTAAAVVFCLTINDNWPAAIAFIIGYAWRTIETYRLLSTGDDQPTTDVVNQQQSRIAELTQKLELEAVDHSICKRRRELVESLLRTTQAELESQETARDQRIDELKREIAAINNSLNTARKTNEQLKRELAIESERLLAEQERVKAIQAKQKDWRDGIREAKASEAELRKQLDIFTRKLGGLEKELAAVSVERDQLLEAKKQLTAKLATTQNNQRVSAELRASAEATLERVTQEQETKLRADKASLEQELVQIKRQLVQVEQHAQAVKAKAAKQERRQAETIRNIVEEQETKLRAEAVKQRQELTEVKEQARLARMSCARLEQELTHVKNERDQLAQQGPIVLIDKLQQLELDGLAKITLDDALGKLGLLNDRLRRQLAKQEAESESKDKLSCSVCFDKLADCVLNCSHICMCMTCANKVGDCPVCRTIITSRTKCIFAKI